MMTDSISDTKATTKRSNRMILEQLTNTNIRLLLTFPFLIKHLLISGQ